MEDRIQVTMKGGVADVRLVRTDKMNALDDAMFQALIDTGERLKAEKGVRAIVLSGEGRAFCAGLDMGNFAKMASGERSGGRSSTGEALVTAHRTPGGSNRAQHAVMVWREQAVPVIAAIHGVAFGGGFQLALGADIRFVTPDVRMAVLEIKWGLVPDMAGLVLMKRLVRDDVARELTYTGRIFDGDEALRLGFATRALAAEIASKNPHAIRGAKRLLDMAPDADQHAILMAESQEQTALIGSPNQVEAVMSNMQKRAAVYAD
jgi:enoyl-CoA hydratase/carnithine racemase